MTYEALTQGALREADQRDLTDNPHVGGGEPDRWDDDGTSDKLRALVAAIEAKDEALMDWRNCWLCPNTNFEAEVERLLQRTDAALGVHQ